MNKILIYTSNIGTTPKNLREVVHFAEANDKFRIAEVGLNAHLADVKVGDNIITKKGNSLYIIKAFDKTVDELSGADREYIDTLVRNYDVKKVNITSVANRIKFETWCKEARPLLNTESKNSKTSTMTGNSIKNFGERLKANFMPTEAKDVRIATDGNICVATSEGYVAIDNNFELTTYPDELTLDFPVFILPKPIAQLKPGDVIARDRSYAKVKSVKDGKITVVGYTGAGSTVHPIKDFLLGQTTVKVVVSFAGNIEGNFNPMLLLALSKDKKNDNLLPLLMMNQTGGALTANPMMLAMLAGDGDFDFKDLLMYSAFGGQNLLGNLFGGAASAAPQAKVAPVEGPKAE